MTKRELAEKARQAKHLELHRAFDQLLAAFIADTKRPVLGLPIEELMTWSAEQTFPRERGTTPRPRARRRRP